MKSTITHFSFVLVCLFISFIQTTKAQTNSAAPYCVPSCSISPCNQPGLSNLPSNTVNDFIDSFLTTGATTNIVNTNSGCNGLANNYIFYCQHYLLTIPGQVITCSVQSGINFSQSFGLFIDWNQNNNFEIPAERVGASVSPPTAANWFVMTFTVPTNQTNGAYRMRLRCYNTPNNTYVDPCNQANVGETEDYRLYVGNAGPAPLSAFLGYNTPLCTGGTLNFILNQTGSSATTFFWLGPNGFNSVSQNPSIQGVSQAMAGVYSVDIVDGPCAITKTVAVNVTQTPTITVNSATICSGGSATLVASGANTYNWSSGQLTPTIVVYPIATTTFVVTGNTNSCTATKVATVTTVPNFSMNVSSSSTVICAGSTVTLTASGANTYTWDNGNTGSTNVITPTTTTNYTVTGTSSPCNSQAVFTQYVSPCTSAPAYTSLQSTMGAWPNPFNNEISLNAPLNTVFVIQNALGQAVMTGKADGRKIITNELSTGLYYLFLSNNTDKQVIKILKN